MGNVVSGLQVGSFLILCMITWGRTEESKSEPRSVDAHRLTIEGQAWPGEGSPYGRLPARMQGQVRPELWQRATKLPGQPLLLRAMTRH